MIIQFLTSLIMELLPALVGLIVKALIERAPRSLNAANLGLKIARMLAEIRRGSLEDYSEEKAPRINLSGKLVQRLDMTEAEIDEVDLSKGKFAQVSAYKLKAGRLKAGDMVTVIMDLAKSEVKEVDLRGAKINTLDLFEAKVDALNIAHADILSFDLSEAIIGAIVGGNSARVYLQDRWKARILKEE